MSVTNPNHLFEQADRLIAPSAAGALRQVDLRRAVSAAYYGVFHAVMAAAAAQFIGATKGNTTEYGLVYRSIGHRQLTDLCKDLKKPTLTAKFASRVPAGGMGSNFVAFASAVSDLQEKRHTADYDPLARIRMADAKAAVATARAGLNHFAGLPLNVRLAFLSLLVFGTRSD